MSVGDGCLFSWARMKYMEIDILWGSNRKASDKKINKKLQSTNKTNHMNTKYLALFGPIYTTKKPKNKHKNRKVHGDLRNIHKQSHGGVNKMFLQVSQISTENTCAKVSFLISCRPQSCNLIKIESSTVVFLWILRNFKSTFFIEYLQ